MQDLDLGVVERRGRLVHDQQLRVVGQRLADLHHLLLGDREVADELLRPQRQVQALDQLARLRVEPALAGEEPALRGSRPMKRFCATVRSGIRLNS